MRQSIREQFETANWVSVISIALMCCAVLSIPIAAKTARAMREAREARASLERFRAKHPEMRIQSWGRKTAAPSR